ncbi:Hypothetical predicted protein [Mytilus galloprovincialis]|uniref:Uncharacterized protein n=1 Tax=Mytilus galloprovincialis TaxID=29158 RepID=A0A8B6GUQ5_MYTGA|nr:Hypothetical predicted protein [Mytilus galloprovincialis]
MNLDMMILARCAPGHSFVNPAERVMSILNLALQNVALERKESTEEMKKILKNCNSMAAVRSLAEKTPEVKTAWIESIEPVASLLRNRFLRLKLKDDPVKAMDPVRDDEIDIMKRHLRALFPDLNLTKLQKVHTKTDDTDRPSLKAKPSKEKGLNPGTVGHAGLNVAQEDHEMEHEQEEFGVPTPDAHMCITQNARSVVVCVECRKPRIVYSNHKLTDRQQISVTISTSEYEYTCGSPLLPPTNTMHKKVMCKLNLNCNSHVELAYYGSGLGQLDICSFCGGPEADTNVELKKQYKTVLPLCKTCESKGIAPFIQRPYGKSKKK